jgi:ectoine hydroxylase-related dioxygenase (phytanoyl-CoA dioxygenase family)
MVNMSAETEVSLAAELDARGFAVLKSLVSPGLIDELEEEIDQLARFHLARMGLKRRSNEAFSDLLLQGGKFRKSLFPQLKHLNSVTAIALSIKKKLDVLGFAASVGMRYPVVNWSIKADVPGEDKFLLPMHQDYKTPCHLAFRVWVPMRDANATNGTIRYLEGSHAAGYAHHDTTNPELPTIPENMYDAEQVKLLEIAAGDGFLFHPLLFHASVAASEDVVKFVVMVNVWDLATLADEEDRSDPIPARLALAAARDRARDA